MLVSLKDAALLQTLGFLDVVDLLHAERLDKRLFSFIRQNRNHLRKLRKTVQIAVHNLLLKFLYKLDFQSSGTVECGIKIKPFKYVSVNGGDGKTETHKFQDDLYVFISEKEDRNYGRNIEVTKRVLTNKPYARLEECLGCISRNYEVRKVELTGNAGEYAEAANQLLVRTSILTAEGDLESNVLQFYSAFTDLMDLQFHGTIPPGLSDESLLGLRRLAKIQTYKMPSKLTLTALRQVIEEFRLGVRKIDNYYLNVLLPACNTDITVLNAIHECSPLCGGIREHFVQSVDGERLLVQAVNYSPQTTADEADFTIGLFLQQSCSHKCPIHCDK